MPNSFIIKITVENFYLCCKGTQLCKNMIKFKPIKNFLNIKDVWIKSKSLSETRIGMNLIF